MTGFITFFHIIVCVFLVVIILMQSGRGGGLTEAFASAENFFGAKTNEMLVKGTTILVCIFIITCLSLAYLSNKRDQSLMSSLAAQKVKAAEADKAAKDVPETKAVAVPSAAATVPAASRAEAPKAVDNQAQKK